MTKFIHNYFHPLSGKLIFWNILLLVLIKVVLPQSAFQLATLVGSIPTFDSREVIRITNEARSINQLAPLQSNPQLDIAAEQKLNDMAIQEYFAHISPAGVTPWFWIQQAQYKYKVAGENLAIGFTTSQDTVEAWLNSPSHRANILNSEYQDIGVAIKGVSIGETTGILVVQMFGKPTVQVAVAGSPTPGATPALSPVPSTTPSPTTVSGQTRGETEVIMLAPELAIQHVSTDIAIPAVEEPVQVSVKDIGSVKKLSGAINNTFALYSMFLAILSIVAFFLLERSHLPAQAGHMALKVSLHTAVFLLALILPVAETSLRALIF